MVDIYVDIDDEYGTAEINGFVGKQHVVSFATWGKDKWTTAMSSCLPSDIEKAKLYVECYSRAVEELKKISENESCRTKKP